MRYFLIIFVVVKNDLHLVSIYETNKVYGYLLKNRENS